MPKKMKGSLVSPGMVCYAEKQEKPFWFSSLDQIVHFDAIIFCRTFVELFWSVRVDRKKSHYNSRVSLHEAPTKNTLVQRQEFEKTETDFLTGRNCRYFYVEEKRRKKTITYYFGKTFPRS